MSPEPTTKKTRVKITHKTQRLEIKTTHKVFTALQSLCTAKQATKTQILEGLILSQHSAISHNPLPTYIKPSPPKGYYKAHNGMEAIDVIEAYNLSFSLGNALKYIIRAGKKESKREDLIKAIWYLNRELENEKAE